MGGHCGPQSKYQATWATEQNLISEKQRKEGLRAEEVAALYLLGAIFQDPVRAEINQQQTLGTLTRQYCSSH